MKYRTIRFKDGEDRVSMLGLGTMRFPLKEDGSIDRELAEEMLDRAVRAGVNYIDTAYFYHNSESEPFVGEALRKYPRDQFFLATKLPVWAADTPEDAERIFEDQLKRLHVKYIDYYLFHALDRERWNKLVKSGIIAWAEELKKMGKIRHLGFSFHDSYETFREILTYRQWDFCQIQYNYMDTEEQAGDKGLLLAEKMGIPVIVMEPVKGGRLAAFSGDAEEALKSADENASIASWALRWVGSHPWVKVILSGMSSMEQIEDNLQTFENFKPLSPEEEKAVEKAAQIIKSRVRNGCTACGYCMPCPFGVDIPGNFAIWNRCAMYEEGEKAKKDYEAKKEKNASADFCKQCGKCEEACPQGIAIRKDLETMKVEFTDMNDMAAEESQKA